MAQIGNIGVETENNGTVKVPVFDTGDSGSDVYEMVRVQTAVGVGFIAVISNTSDAAFPYLRVQTENNGVCAVHNEASLFDPNEAVIGTSSGDLYAYDIEGNQQYSISLSSDPRFIGYNEDEEAVAQEKVFDANDGSELRVHNNIVLSNDEDQHQELSNKRIYYHDQDTEDYVYGVLFDSVNDTEIWRQPILVGGLDNNIDSTAVHVTDGYCYSTVEGDDKAGVVEFALSDGSSTYYGIGRGKANSLSVDDTYLYECQPRDVYALDRANQMSQAWSNSVSDSLYDSASIHGNNGVIVTGEFGTKWYNQDGSLKWENSITGLSVEYNNTVNRVVISGTAGELYVLDPVDGSQIRSWTANLGRMASGLDFGPF